MDSALRRLGVGRPEVTNDDELGAQADAFCDWLVTIGYGYDFHDVKQPLPPGVTIERLAKAWYRDAYGSLEMQQPGVFGECWEDWAGSLSEELGLEWVDPRL